MNLMTEAIKYMVLLHEAPKKAEQYLSNLCQEVKESLLLASKHILFEVMTKEADPMSDSCYEYCTSVPGSCHSSYSNRLA